MKITRSIWATLAGVAFAVGASVAGCGTTNNINTGGQTSGLGESCTRTFDCKSGLVCLQNVCFPEAPSSDAGAIDGGDAVAPTGPHLGLQNESCQTSSDCQSPLECVGNSCSVVSYDLTSTGMSCTGECNTAADCCELPVGFDVFLESWASIGDGGVETFHPDLSTANLRCQDLLAYIGGDATVCNAATFPVNEEGLAQGCFDYDTYCNCGPNTWACTNNACSYTAPCTTSSAIAGGCPTESRTARALGSTCNIPAAATSGTCQAGCVSPADCSDTVPAGSGHACSAADAGNANCTCYQSACYFKCSKDLDCAGGSVCDPATSLCKKAGCTTAADCVLSTGNPLAQCAAGACQIACTNDVQCGAPSSICVSGFCKASGCSSNADCTGSQHLFCVTAAATTYSSAVTN